MLHGVNPDFFGHTAKCAIQDIVHGAPIHTNVHILPGHDQEGKYNVVLIHVCIC